MILVYAQGMALLKVASDKYQYQLNLEAIARIWRGGCIIRATLLDDICAAFHANTDLANLLLDQNLSQQLMMNIKLTCDTSFAKQLNSGIADTRIYAIT